MASCIPAASAPSAPRSELRLMKAIGRKTSFASPGLTIWSIASGMVVVEASRHAGQARSPYSMISTGASGSPRTLPAWGTPSSWAWTSSVPVIDDGASSSPPPARLTPTTMPTTTSAATTIPIQYSLFTSPASGRCHP